MENKEKIDWILCPKCGSKTRTQIRTHTVLEDFYAVGALADELTNGFHMEERGYIDRTEVNSRLIAFARELERILDKWETHATLIA